MAVDLFASMNFYEEGAPQLQNDLSQFNGKIIGGEPISIEEINYQVSVLYIGHHICGGALISRTHVITTAHCVNSVSISTISVRAGSSILNDGGVVAELAAVAIHPLYDEWRIDYDLSILTLNSPLAFSASIGIIDLPPYNSWLEAGYYGIVAGWGTTYEGSAPSSILQAVYVPILSHSICTRAYGVSQITDRMFCAGPLDGGRDSCQGDSGGGFVFEGILYGIVSWGTGCARPSYPGVYADISSMRQFIEDVTNL